MLPDPHPPVSVQALAERLVRKYGVGTVPVGRWTLDHRLLRSTPATVEDKTRPRFVQLLTVSSLRAGSTFVSVSALRQSQHQQQSQQKGTAQDSDAQPMVIAIPTQQTEAYYGLLAAKFGALWTARPGLHVLNGVTYNVGEFVVRLGELRQPGTGQTGVRGIVVSVEVAESPETQREAAGRGMKGEAPGEGENSGASGSRNEVEERDAGALHADGEGGKSDYEERLEESRKAIRDVWNLFEVEGAREAWSGSSASTGWERTVEQVRTWCEALRFRV